MSSTTLPYLENSAKDFGVNLVGPPDVRFMRPGDSIIFYDIHANQIWDLLTDQFDALNGLHYGSLVHMMADSPRCLGVTNYREFRHYMSLFAVDAIRRNQETEVLS